MLTTTTEPLFTNQALVAADLTTVQQTLANPQQLLNWNPAISAVTPTETGLIIDRAVPALNPTETLTIKTTSDQVIYTSQGGRLAYQLVFTLTTQAHQTQIQEAFYPATTGHLNLPLTLLAPIAKHAFAANLQTFKQLLSV